LADFLAAKAPRNIRSVSRHERQEDSLLGLAAKALRAPRKIQSSSQYNHKSTVV
jgi:hypothetical protein